MKKFISLLIVVIVIGVVLGALLGARESPVPKGNGLADAGSGMADIPQLSLEGFSRVSIELYPEAFSILLASGCRQLSMVTSQEQIYSISMGMEKAMGMRPLPHDLIGNMIGEFGIEVLMVKVESMREGTYYAKLILKQGNKILNMDSRPSDAIAIAVRTGSLVYVRNELLEQYGSDIC